MSDFEYRRFIDAFHAIHKQLAELEKATRSLATALVLAKQSSRK